MSGTDPTTPLDPCGCCAGLPAAGARWNVAGRPRLDFRLGTHATLLARMLARLHAWEVPGDPAPARRPLAALTTRRTDDPAIALLDAWAVVGDVVTFYQERIANEGFLRTATERRSVLELARAIGYELNPGVSAAAYLAFTVDEADGAPAEAVIPRGTQVLSVPSAQGELPQTFETGAEFTARRAWNALVPRPSRPQVLATDAASAYLAGTATGLKAGDRLLLLTAGAPELKRVAAVVADRNADRTVVTFTDGATPPAAAVDDLESAVFDPAEAVHPLTRDEVAARIYDKLWTESDLQAFLDQQGWDADTVLAYVDDLRAAGTASASEVHALRETVACFGYNAPRWALLPVTATEESGDVTERGGYPDSWDDGTRTVWEDSQGDALEGGVDLYLERVVAGLVPDGWLVLAAPGVSARAYRIADAVETARTDYALSGKVTALTLRDADGTVLTNADRPTGFCVSTTVAHTASEALALAGLPEAVDLAGAEEVWLDRLVLGLAPGQTVVVRGEETGAGGREISELAVLDEIAHGGGRTRLVFTAALAHSFVRDTVTINANVVFADHGETVSGEVLGSGDGARTHQTFTLKAPPLTHVSAATPSGAESTLTVRVDGVAWEAQASLYGLDGSSRSYVVRIGDDQSARVIFGDGKSGARLVTGSENVTATYRTGIGSDGEVPADSLTLLKTRPFGIRAVTNPLPASGADDPETLADLRVNAPLTVKTLDRVVSLQDYEDFARAFAGIGKARADLLWDGEREHLYLTVADADGDAVASLLAENLRDAIEAARDPLYEFTLGSYRHLAFSLAAELVVDAAYVWDDVAAAARTALIDAFSFAERRFAQPVTAAEVAALLHTVPGVVAVDINALHPTGEDPAAAPAPYTAVLPARAARFDPAGGGPLPAELLVIHAQDIELTGKSS